MTSPLRRYLPVLLALLVATGCSEQPTRPDTDTPPAPAETRPVIPQQPVEDEVERLLALAARSGKSAAASEARLDAAAELLRRGDLVRARALLDELASTTLQPRQQARHALLGTQLDLDAGNAQGALLRLQSIAPAAQQYDSALQVELALTRADVFSALDRHLDSAHERTLIHPWLSDETMRRDNVNALFAALAAVDMPELERAATAATREDWRGWLELATLVRDIRRGPRTQLTELARWERRYAQIAPLRSAADMLPVIRERIRQPARIALLLPLSGDAAAGGLSVLHGYLAEHLQQSSAGETLPPVAVVDTAATNGGFAAAYAGAIADGADFVIGPLLKEDLAAFGPALPVSVPTLALNFSDAPPPLDGHLYSFGLDAIDEVDQLARSAHERDFRRVVLLSDDSQLSQRQLERFRERWHAIAAEDVADALTLTDLNLNAFRRDFERMLLIEGSRQRTAALTRLLGRELISEARRRQDLDLLVMFANPVAARSLRPLVSFLYAGDLPLWATSQSNAAQTDRRDDRDLETVHLLDAPWFSTAERPLRDALGDGAPPGGMQRLAALGVDACRLQSRTGLLEWMNALGLSGATGELLLDGNRRLHRRLSWYVFTDGIAVAEDARASLAAPSRIDSLSTEGETPWSTEAGMQPTQQP